MARTMHGHAAMLRAILLLVACAVLGVACGSSSSGAGGTDCQFWQAVCTCTCEGVAVDGLLGSVEGCGDLLQTQCSNADDGGADAGSPPHWKSCVQKSSVPDC